MQTFWELRDFGFMCLLVAKTLIFSIFHFLILIILSKILKLFIGRRLIYFWLFHGIGEAILFNLMLALLLFLRGNHLKFEYPAINVQLSADLEIFWHHSVNFISSWLHLYRISILLLIIILLKFHWRDLYDVSFFLLTCPNFVHTIVITEHLITFHILIVVFSKQILFECCI